MYNFDYLKPLTLAGAVQALKDEGAQAISGGQTLLPTLKARLGMPEKLVDLKSVPALRGVSVDGSGVTIGATTTHAEVAGSADVQATCPALAELAGNIGDAQVRHRGTIGGSLANNDPSACYPAAALGLGATIVTNTREIAADDYFQGMFTTALEEGEIITAVRFPKPARAAYVKFVQPASRFALVGVFVAQTASGVRVAVTGASEEGVFRASDIEAALSTSFAPEAAKGVSVSPEGMIGDLFGTPEYRASMVSVMAGRAVAKALA
ncbi:MAG: xanthine dehydrogenase family protein subunit M [Neomegalonema sp.]|nr:xanthine dehydrogenase family protein subunit M [Neomegalonema sp.]